MTRWRAGLRSINMLALPLGGAAASEPPAQTPGRSVAALGPRDLAWLDKARGFGRELLEFYAQTTVVTPANLDAAFRAWKLDRSADRAPDHIVAGGLGALFGDYVVAHHGSRWMLVSDSQGKELAVVSPARLEIYPIAAVRKRQAPQNEDINFFEPIWKVLAAPQGGPGSSP
jgi:hypothetical protein